MSRGMSHGTSHGRLTSLTLCLTMWCGAGTGLAAQTTTANPGIVRNTFLDGWMAELLHADHDAATRSYTAAMKASNLPGFQSELATLRLWESSWKPSKRKSYREAARKRGLVTRDLFSSRGVSFLMRSIDADKFEKALAADDKDTLEGLRDRLAATAKRYSAWLRDPRSLVQSELHNFRGETDRIDSEFESLKRQYKKAKDADDNRKAQEIWFRIQRHLRTKRITASRRVNGKRWSAMTRLHLEGHHERASGMEKRLLRGGRQRFTAENLMRKIRGWSPAYRVKRTKTVLARLDAQFQRRELITEERTALRALRTRLDSLVAAGEHEKALVLAARTPYRDRLFGTR
jgi:molybdopterin converting factor small subunit